jgi:hypothetical protein
VSRARPASRGARRAPCPPIRNAPQPDAMSPETVLVGA